MSDAPANASPVPPSPPPQGYIENFAVRLPKDRVPVSILVLTKDDNGDIDVMELSDFDDLGDLEVLEA